MAMKFRIPPAHKKPFLAFLGFTTEKREKLISSLEKTELGSLPKQITTDIYKELDIDKEELQYIIEALFSIIRLKETVGIPINELIEGIIDALKELAETKEDLPEDVKVQLSRLLMSDKPFALTIKSATLSGEREKLLIDSKILTDIRPVFRENENFEIGGLLVLHNMKLEYVENSESKEIFLGLDEKDLKKLGENIDRAYQKAKALRKKLEGTNIDFIETGD